MRRGFSARVVVTWLCLATGVAWPLTGRELMDQAEARNHLATWTDRTRLVTIEGIDADAVRVTREARVSERTEAHGVHRTLIDFLAPDDFRGTRLLHISRRGVADEYWIWQPSARRARRLGGNAGGSAHRDEIFFGNDLSYRDLELVVRVLQWDEGEAEATFDGDEPCGASACRRVTLVPRAKNEFPFVRYRLWFGRDDLLLRRVELIDAAAAVEKRIECDDYFASGAVMTPRRCVIEHPATGTRSTITTREVAYDTGLDDALFSIATLGEGR